MHTFLKRFSNPKLNHFTSGMGYLSRIKMISIMIIVIIIAIIMIVQYL